MRYGSRALVRRRLEIGERSEHCESLLTGQPIVGIDKAGRSASRGPMSTAAFLFLAVLSALAPTVANGSP